MRQRHDRRVGCVAGDEGGREAGLQRRVLVHEEVRVEVGRDGDGAVSHPPADAVQVLALVRHGGRVGCRRSWKRTWPSRSFLARGRPALKTGRVQRSGLASGSEPTDGTTVLLVASYGVGPLRAAHQPAQLRWHGKVTPGHALVAKRALDGPRRSTSSAQRVSHSRSTEGTRKARPAATVRALAGSSR